MIPETTIILITMFITVVGPSVVVAILGRAAIKALARNPSASAKIFIGMALLLTFVEALAIITLLILFQLFSK